MTKQLTAVYEQHDKWIIAYLEEIPGVNTQGKRWRKRAPTSKTLCTSSWRQIGN